MLIDELKASGVSSETIRRARKVERLQPGLLDKIQSGDLSVFAAYREALGKDTVGFYAMIPPDVKELIEDWADRLGEPQKDFICRAVLFYDAITSEGDLT